MDRQLERINWENPTTLLTMIHRGEVSNLTFLNHIICIYIEWEKFIASAWWSRQDMEWGGFLPHLQINKMYTVKRSFALLTKLCDIRSRDVCYLTYCIQLGEVFCLNMYTRIVINVSQRSFPSHLFTLIRTEIFSVIPFTPVSCILPGNCLKSDHFWAPIGI